ncbi:MAG: membrane dipeptidase, partial [Gemmatimonadota bacterium]
MAKSRSIPVFDGHNDTLLHLALKAPGTEGDFLTGREGHIDLPKARAGGLAGGLFAMFVPSTKWAKEIRWREQGPDGPKMSKGWDVPIAGRIAQPGALNSVMAMMASLFRLQKLSKGQVKVVTTHRQLTS